VLFAEAAAIALRRDGIEVHLVHTASAALEAVGSARFDLVLMDIGLPDRSGMTVGAEIARERGGPKVVAMTALDDPDGPARAARSGFHGYLTKHTSLHRLVSTIEAVLSGRVVMTHSSNGAGTGLSSRQDRMASLMASKLTGREREVLLLLTRGMSGARMAEALQISQNTVRTHVQGILDKLQVHSRLEAAAFAVEHGLVESNGLR
jgi:two-component system nitrate/nitrite response regulator NarL